MGRIREVYAVINDGELVYVSRDYEKAQEKADELYEKSVQGIFDELEIEEDDENGRLKASFLSGYNEGTYDVVEIDLSEYKSGDTISIGNIDIDYDDVRKKLRKR